MPTRVGFVGTHDPTFARHALIAAGLRARGYDVQQCVVPTWGSTAQRVRAAQRGLANPGLALRLARAYARLQRALDGLAEQPDVLYVGYPGQLDTIVLSLLRPRSRLVLDGFVALDETLADRGIGAGCDPSRRLARLLDRLAFRLADVVVVDTAAHLRRFVRDYGLAPARAVIVPVGAADVGPLPGSPRLASDGDSEPLRVLYFGGFIPLHGVSHIVEAARILGPDRGIQVDLVGEGQEAAAVARTLAAAPLPHVRLLRTWMAEAQLVAEHIAAADVCLGVFADAPKTMDVVPAKVYLALACGRAVLTADTPAVREELLARSRGGPPLLTCPPGDAHELARALVRLRDDAPLRTRLAAAGRVLYERHFRPEQIVEPLIARLEAIGDRQ